MSPAGHSRATRSLTRSWPSLVHSSAGKDYPGRTGGTNYAAALSRASTVATINAENAAKRNPHSELSYLPLSKTERSISTHTRSWKSCYSARNRQPPLRRVNQLRHFGEAFSAEWRGGRYGCHKTHESLISTLVSARYESSLR
jgi:hypothetical protein